MNVFFITNRVQSKRFLLVNISDTNFYRKIGREEGGGKGNTTKIRNGLHHTELKNAWGVVFFPNIQRFVRQVNAGEGNCPSFFLVT